MRVFSLILPAFVVLVLLVTTHNLDLWWAYLLMLVGSEGIVFLLHYLLKKNTAKEYVSGYVICVEHYNEWVEKVKRTRYERDSNGNSREVTYYEYVTHPEYWQECYNTGHTRLISQQYFYLMCQMFGTGLDSFQTYHTNCVSGGGGQRCNWNGNEWATTTATFKQGYYNPILNSNSIFKFRNISAEEAQKYELFEYPQIVGKEQDVVCFQTGIDHQFTNKPDSPYEDIQVLFQHVNAFLGKTREIHVFVLVFDAKKYSVETAEIQRSYWHGGNKNELTICIGVDGQTVKWSEAFSWMENPSLHVEIQGYFLQNTQFDLIKFVYWLPKHLDKWKRREVKEFKYLGTNLSKESKIWLLVTAVVLSAFCVFATLQWVYDPVETMEVREEESVAKDQYRSQYRTDSPEVYNYEPASSIDVSEVTDYDGNTYKAVKIGRQLWMAENLRTTHYADGTEISLTDYHHPQKCSSSNNTEYGLLYSWYGMVGYQEGGRNICPDGWHVPSDAEWKQLELALGMSETDANSTGWRGSIAAKLSGDTGWTSSSNANAAGDMSAPERNITGFNALPAGARDFVFPSGFGETASFWSATEELFDAYYRKLSYDVAGVNRDHTGKDKHFSVRCVKN